MGKLIVIALIAFAAWMFFKPPADAGTVHLATVATAVEQTQTPPRDIAQVPDKAKTTAPVADTAQSGEQSYTRGFWVGTLAAVGAVFAGGWFAASLGFGAWALIAILFCIPATAIGILSEYSDSRIEWFWRDSRRGERERIDTHEFVTTLIFIATLALLNYGGLPVWATLMSWKAAPAIVLWVGLGIVWSVYRWKDFSAFLHELFTETTSQLALQIKSNIDEVLKLRKEYRKHSGLEDGVPLPSTPADVADRTQDQRRALNHLFEREDLIREALVKADGDEEVQFSDDDLKFWSAQLGRSTPEKTMLVPEFFQYVTAEATKLSPTSKNAHKGQLFLWVFFWPFSVALRAIRKIVTLRILHDLFNAFLKRFGFIYDRIEAANKIEIEVAERRGGTPTPTAPAEAPKLREVGKD